jgi:hypothetical protein
VIDRIENDCALEAHIPLQGFQGAKFLEDTLDGRQLGFAPGVRPESFPERLEADAEACNSVSI